MIDALTPTLEQLVAGSVAITARAIAAADADLTFPQWRVLQLVGACKDGMSVGEIAMRIGAHASPASRVVSRLRHRGLVDAARDSHDARVVRVNLTEAGREMREQILELRTSLLISVAQDAALEMGDLDVVARLAHAFEPYA